MDSNLGGPGKPQNSFRGGNLPVSDDEYISIAATEQLDGLGQSFGQFGSAAGFDGFKEPARLIEVGPCGFDHFRSEGSNLAIEGDDAELIVVAQDAQTGFESFPGLRKRNALHRP